MLLLLSTTSLLAQPAVVELGGNAPQRNQASAAAPAAQDGSNRILMDLYTQLQSLQQEVQTLRGMMEEQERRVRQMEAQQRDRYLDIDRRLSELTTGQGQQGAASPTAATVAGVTNPGAIPGQMPDPVGSAVPVPVAVPAGPMSEQELYRNALSLLLDESDYEGSIRLFQRYIDEHPRGSFLTNAYYWQGEALILVQRYTQAMNMFNRLLDDYPDDPKAPGALLKVGVIHSQTGDRTRAEEAWRSISRVYPDSATEIRAAEDYLRRN